MIVLCILLLTPCLFVYMLIELLEHNAAYRWCDSDIAVKDRNNIHHTVNLETVFGKVKWWKFLIRTINLLNNSINDRLNNRGSIQHTCSVLTKEPHCLRRSIMKSNRMHLALFNLNGTVYIFMKSSVIWRVN